MNSKTQLIILCAAIFFLSACSTVGDIKSSEPVAAEAATGTQKQAIDCILDQTEQKSSLIPYVRDNTITLFSAGFLGSGSDPVWVITLDTNNGETIATIRGRSDFIIPSAARRALLDRISPCLKNSEKYKLP